MGLDSQVTWIKKEDSPPVLESDIRRISTLLWEVSLVVYIEHLTTLFSCVRKAAPEVCTYSGRLLWWVPNTCRTLGPLCSTCVQAQLRHFQGFLTVAWWCLREPGWMPTLAWNQRTAFLQGWEVVGISLGASPHEALIVKISLKLYAMKQAFRDCFGTNKALFCEVLWECLDY